MINKMNFSCGCHGAGISVEIDVPKIDRKKV